MKTEIVSIMAVCFCALSAPPAKAAIVTIEIEAEIYSVSDPYNFFEGNIKVGDIIKGTYSYDTSTPDSEPLGYAGLYEHHNPTAGISLNIGDFNFRTDPDNVDFVVAILNDYLPSKKDQFWMRSYNNLPLPSGVAVDGISWQLDENFGNAISGTALPTDPLVLDDWQENILSFGSDRRYGIFAHVTSAVPEPSTILLFGLGGLFLRKRG